jgi:hypothetical protein
MTNQFSTENGDVMNGTRERRQRMKKKNTVELNCWTTTDPKADDKPTKVIVLVNRSIYGLKSAEQETCSTL